MCFSTDYPSWRLPRNYRDRFMDSRIRYHCFIDGASLCGKYKEGLADTQPDIESGEILVNPQLACTKCRELWIKLFLPGVFKGGF